MQNVALFSVDPGPIANLVELQAAALEATANAVVITDLAGTVIWIKSAFERLTGYTHGELLGQNTRILKSGENSRALYEKMWRTILGGKIWQGELINRRKDGILYNEEMTITPVQDKRRNHSLHRNQTGYHGAQAYRRPHLLGVMP
jgi:PAS domain S-box-containing protein